MTDAEKLAMLKSVLGVGASDTSQDDLFNVYLSMSKSEIINWMYVNYADVPTEPTMPDKYDIVQVNAVVAGYNIQGGENEYKHTENGITREFHYSDMIDYIRAHVYQLVRM